MGAKITIKSLQVAQGGVEKLGDVKEKREEKEEDDGGVLPGPVKDCLSGGGGWQIGDDPISGPGGQSSPGFCGSCPCCPSW